MNRGVLAVCSIAVLFAAGCASQRSSQSLRYALVTPTEVIAFRAGTNVDDLRALRAGAPNDLLWFERDGGQYIVSDPATVERAGELIRYLETELRTLRYSTSRSSPAAPYYSGDWNKGIPPYEPAVPKVMLPSGEIVNNEQQTENWQAQYNQRQENPIAVPSANPDQDRWRQTLEGRVQRALGDLGRLFDKALANGVAQKMGPATPAQSQ